MPLKKASKERIISHNRSNENEKEGDGRDMAR